MADSLEKEWNEKLRALAEAQQHYERQRETDQAALSERQRTQTRALAGDFPRLWRDPSTPDRERKRMVRLLIEDVTLRKQGDIAVHIRFRGGATRSLSVPRVVPRCELRKHKAEVVAEIDRLLEHHTYSEIATILNERGLRTGGGVKFNSTNLSLICRSRRLKSRYDRLREKGLLTIAEVTKKLGITKQTVQRWQHSGLLRGHVYNDNDSCLYEDPGATLPRTALRQKRLAERRPSRQSVTCPQEVQYEA